MVPRFVALCTAMCALTLSATPSLAQDSPPLLCEIDGETWVFGFNSLQRFLDSYPGAHGELGFSAIDGDCGRARDTFVFQQRVIDNPDEDPDGAEDLSARLSGGFTPQVAGGVQSSYMPAIAILVDRPGEPGKSFCGGVLVNENWIMTSAHCIPGDIEPRERDIALIAFVESADGQNLVCLTGPGEVPVSAPEAEPQSPCSAEVTGRAHLHPDYDGGQWFGQPDDEDDLALIELPLRATAPLTFALFDRYSVEEDNWVSVDGYSFTNRGLQTSNYDRTRGSFKVDDVDSRDIEFDSTEAYQICRGDSGSPVRIVVNGTSLVAGLISQLRVPPWSDDRCGEEGAGVQATRIWRPKEAWIEGVIGRQCVETGRVVRCFGDSGGGGGGGTPPPPSCSANEKCCEPAPDGSCLLCWPRDLHCP